MEIEIDGAHPKFVMAINDKENSEMIPIKKPLLSERFFLNSTMIKN